jgi:ERCC4-type nuclease
MARGRGHISTRTPGLVAKVAAQLPGIDRKAFDVEDHFKSVYSMVNADRKDWRIPGVIGEKTADEVYRVIRGLEESNNGQRKP